MFTRILDISDAPARLSVRHGQLLLTRDTDEPVSVPLAEIAALVIAHPQVSLTQAVLCGLLEHGGALVVCDQRRLPIGMVLPLAGHYVQAERFAAQSRAAVPLRKRLWKQIVRAKITAQAQVLVELRGTDGGLTALVPLVRSGDPANVEARAARRYWTHLFPGSDFRRDRDGQDQNRLLNYGYAVLRALVARALAGAGLHPSLGIHHRNRYNAFCLADDVMEPFRPVVDRAVARFVDAHGADRDMDAEVRRALLASLLGRCVIDRESRTLFESLATTASSLVAVFEGRARALELPREVVIDGPS